MARFLPIRNSFSNTGLRTGIIPLAKTLTVTLSTVSRFSVRAVGMSTSAHTVPPLRDHTLLQPYPFLNNEFIKSSSTGKSFVVTDPASGLTIAEVPDQAIPDVQAAILAASDAFSTFRRTTARERSKLLRKWYDLVLLHEEDLATIITWENGKPVADARAEVKYAASFLEWFSEEAPRVYGDTIPSGVVGNRIITQRQPIGVCALITPWNFPAAMVARKIGPAIAAGCTMVLKAPCETPLTSLALAELARRAGFPKGIFNVVTTHEHTLAVGKELCSHPIVKQLSFTGSTTVGKLLMQQASSTLKKLSFELGGNSPFIVFDDADVDTAVTGAITAKFRGSGQTCICANRIFVHDSIYDAFSNAFAAKICSTFKVGSGYDSNTTHGPLIHTRAVSKVHRHVQNALQSGAKLLYGGKHMPHLGENFYEPTVLTEMTKEMDIFREETFGPVAALFRFKTERQVVGMANDSEVGLAGYLYSGDMARVWRVAEALEVGMVGINTGMISDPATPFGGVKQSGFGREGSKYGIDEFVVIKSMTLGGIGSLQ